MTATANHKTSSGTRHDDRAIGIWLLCCAAMVFAMVVIGGATRLHYFTRKCDSETLIAKLLPFTTSNPMQLDRLELVHQHKGWWVYRLKD